MYAHVTRERKEERKRTEQIETYAIAAKTMELIKTVGLRFIEEYTYLRVSTKLIFDLMEIDV